ncbi:MAG TPA: hypothetical protein VOB72_18525 [Candidatus Dormibacteraeota bacterium]|nr:hypothetical protein [Candidatus Dormibacteraeota bacterium]
MLQRCAAVRTFDRELFEIELAAGPAPDAPDLGDLIELGDVEPLPDRLDEYRVSAPARLHFLHLWWPEGRDELGGTAPRALVEFSARMASRYRAERRPLDELYQLLLADPPAARDLFGRLFAEADERFDLVHCQALVDLLSLPERLPFLSSELLELRDDRQRYLRARSLWSLEHWQIGRFLEPAGARREFERLLDSPAERVLHLSAPGGMGKTMLLRWLIADLCVREPRRVPCARIDLDLVDPTSVCAEPWLVLLELAHQLDQQLPGAPFRELLRERGQLRALLARVPTSTADAAAGLISNPKERARIERDVRDRFLSICDDAALSLGGPILLVFDTLEELVVRVDPSAELDRFVDLLAEVHDGCEALRLVLSGRYDLRRRMPSFASRFPTVRYWKVPRFGGDECRRYLREIRGLVRDDLVNIIVRRTRGVPFTLALFADVVQDDPSIQREQLESMEQPFEIHLVSRVLARIEDPRVRWLVRYGVIPRTLNYGFVRDVMLPYLRTAMTGVSELDAPERDPIPELRGSIAGDLFPTDALRSPADLDIREVWERLLRFADTSSWVSESPDHETVRFHPNTLRPMRGWLENHPVFEALHRAAADYFERRAQAEPDQWARWTCEAVYHRFQLEGAAAGEYWRRQLQAARRRREPQSRRRLAADVLRRDYFDSAGNVRPRADGSPMMGPETRALACYEAARVDAEEALAQGVGGAHQLWTRVVRSLSELEGLPVAERVVSPAQRAWLEAAVMLSRGQAPEAGRTARSALASAEPSERFGLAALAGEAAAAAAQPEAIELFGRARAEAVRAGERDAEQEALVRQADESARWDRLNEAVSGMRRALNVGGPRRSEIAARLGRLLVLAGQPSAALAAVAEMDAEHDPSPGALAELRRSAALANLAGLRPLAALDDCRLAIDAASGADLAAVAAVHELHGRVLAALKEFQRAFAALELASSLWQKAGRTEEACRCHVRIANVSLHDCGNLRDADRALRVARRFELDSGDVWLGRWLCSIALQAAHGHPDVGLGQVDQLLRGLSVAPVPPRLRIRVAVAALALAPPNPERFLWLLSDAAGRITPAAALGPLLGDLSHAPAIPRHAASVRRLASLLEGERAWGPVAPAPEDAALLWMTSAEADRIGGDARRASGQLARAAVVLRQASEPYFWLRWLESANRLPPAGTQLTTPSAFVETYAEYAALCAAYLVELADRQLRDGREGDAAASLTRASAEVRAVKLRTHLPARISELSGEVAERRGEAAAALMREAAERYAQLGSDLDRDRLLARASRQAAGRTAVTRAELPAALNVRLVDGGPPDAAGQAWIETELTMPSGLDIEPWRAPLAAAVPLGHGSVVDQLGLAERLARRPAELGRALGAALLPAGATALPPLATAAGGGEPVEIRLAVADPRLHGIPWELASPEPGLRSLALTPGISRFYRFFSSEASARHDWRRLQWSLNQLGLGKGRLGVDGVAGPLTRDALRSFREERGLGPGGLDEHVWRELETALARTMPPRPPRVVLLQAVTQPDDERSAGSRAQGVDLRASYAAAGFDVVTMENPSPGELERWAESAVADGRVPDVLHVSTSIDTVQSTAFLDFAGSSPWDPGAHRLQAGRTRELLTAVLDRVMQVLGDGMAPIVVLDVARPGARAEAARHLVLRNEFAGQLFSLGSTPLLLAVGPGAAPAMDRLYDILVPALAAGRSLGEIASQVRAVAGAVRNWSSEDLDAVLAFAGTALFAHDAAAGLRRTV